jgi:aminoglycoside 6'-N-acetyltransferase I
MPNCLIEPISERESDQALDLLARFFVEEGFSAALPALQENLTARLQDAGGAVLGAWQNGQLIGVATIATGHDLEHGLYAELEDLYVVPQQRGKGTGRALINAARQWSQQQGCTSLSVTVTPEGQTRHNLISFYEKLGFTNTYRTILIENLAQNH